MASKAFTVLKKKAQDPLTKKPRLSRTADVNTIIEELKKLYKVEVKLNDQGDDSEQTVEILSFTDSDPLYAVGGGGGGTTVYPFDMTVTDAGGGNSDVTFEPGSVGSILPSNIFSTFVVANASNYWVYANVTTSSGVISSCSISFETSDQGDNSVTANAPPNSFLILIGYVLAGTGYNIVKANPVPTASLRFQAERTPPIGPGEPAWDYYYGWTW